MGVLIFLIVSLALLSAQPVEPKDKEKCAICGMEINPSSPEVSQIKLKNGTYIFFASPVHALKYYLENKDKVEELWVKDAKTGKWIDGLKAYYVEGESTLKPFKSLIQARKYARGKKVYRISEIGKELLMHYDHMHEGEHHHHGMHGHGKHHHGGHTH